MGWLTARQFELAVFMTQPETQKPRQQTDAEQMDFSPPSFDGGSQSPDFTSYILPGDSPRDKDETKEKEAKEKNNDAKPNRIEDFDFSKFSDSFERLSSTTLDKKLTLKPDDKAEDKTEKKAVKKSDPDKQTADSGDKNESTNESSKDSIGRTIEEKRDNSDPLDIDKILRENDIFQFSDRSDTPVQLANGRGSFSQSGDGKWSFDDGFGGTNPEIQGFAPQGSEKISNVEPLGDESVKLTLSDGVILRSRPDGSAVKFKDENAFDANQPDKIFKKDKSTIDLIWKDGHLESAVNSNGDKYERLRDDLYTKNGVAVKGEFSVKAQNGEFSTSDNTRGIRVTESTEGSVLRELSDETSELTINCGEDNVKRTLKFDKGKFSEESLQLSQPKELVVENPGGQTYVYSRKDDGTYKQGETNRSLEISASRNDAGEYQYTFQDLKSGFLTSAKHDSVKSFTPGSDVIKTEKDGKISNLKFDQGDYNLEYNPKTGEHSGLEDGSRNIRWSRGGADGDWKAEALDANKAFEQPDKFDHEIMNNKELSPEQKARMLENAKEFRDSDQFSETEKEKVFESVSRLLDKRIGTTFSAKERADLGEQTLWHINKERRNMQGANNTCNITDVRGLFLRDEPSVVAKMMADIGNSGQIKTNDGSIIKPDLDSLRPREGSPEKNFPPADNTRTFLGKVWDVTGINAYYQRQTKTVSNSTVPKGSLEYREIEPEGDGDHGHRIIKTDNRGQEWTLSKNFADGTQWGRSEPLDQPYFMGFNMMDVYNQLSSDPKQGKMIVDKDEYVGTSEQAKQFEKLGGVKIDSQQELEDFLSKADFPVIVQLNTAYLKQRAAQKLALRDGKDPSSIAPGVGGEHVVLIDGYQPGDSQSGAPATVNIDNSWYPKDDFLTPQEAKEKGLDLSKHVCVTIEDIHKSMKRKTSGGKAHTWTWVQW